MSRTIQYLHRCLKTIVPLFETKKYLHRCLKTKELLCREQYTIYIDAWKKKNFCVENNTIFTQMLENNRPFVRNKRIFTQMFENQITFASRTIHHLHRCLKTKESLWREQYNIYIAAWKQKTLCVEKNTIFTQMLENKRLFVRIPKLFSYCPFSTTRIPVEIYANSDSSCLAFSILKFHLQSWVPSLYFWKSFPLLVTPTKIFLRFPPPPFWNF